MERTIIQDGEVYINANDLIERIKHHKEYVTGSGTISFIDKTYGLAHDHIIELIEQVKERG